MAEATKVQDIDEALLRFTSEIVLGDAEGEMEMEELSARQVETVFTSLASSRGGIFFDGVQVPFEKVLLKKSRASHSNSYLLPINFS